MRQINIIFIFILLSSTMNATSRPEIIKLVQKIEKYNRLDAEHVGFPGSTTEQYMNFIKLRNTATTEELLLLLNHKNSVVKGYASWALADNKYPKLHEILITFLQTGETVMNQSGCIGLKDELSNVFYYRVLYQKVVNKLTTKDSLFYYTQLQKIDSVIIYSKTKTTLLNTALGNNNANLNTYLRIKELALNKNKSAIIELAKYKKQEDIPLIIEFGENSLMAISHFPDNAFWGFLLKFKNTNKSYDYFSAIASYKDENALKLLSEIYQNCDSVEINNLDQSLVENYCTIYQNLILTIWENNGIIDFTATNRLVNDIPEKSSFSFANGLLSTKINNNFLEYTFNFEKKDSILPLMLNNISKYNKSSILKICNKYISTAEYLNLLSILDLIKKNNIVDTKPNLLNRLTSKNAPYEIFHISETLLSFKDSESNKKLVLILKEKKEDWNRGNWAEAFRKLFSENEIYIN